MREAHENTYIELAKHCIGLDHKNHTDGVVSTSIAHTGIIIRQIKEDVKCGTPWLRQDMQKQERKTDTVDVCIG